jgi:hypothetical protein
MNGLRRFRHRLRRLDRDLAFDAGVDRVSDGQNIAEDCLGRLRRRNIDEIDGYGGVAGVARPADRFDRRVADKAAGAFNDRRLSAPRVGQERRAIETLGPANAVTQPRRRHGIPGVNDRRFVHGLTRRQKQREWHGGNSKAHNFVVHAHAPSNMLDTK